MLLAEVDSVVWQALIAAVLAMYMEWSRRKTAAKVEVVAQKADVVAQKAEITAQRVADVAVTTKETADSYRRDFDLLWNGILERGFVGARDRLLLAMNGGWTVTEEALNVYQDKAPELRAMKVNLTEKFGREPTDPELGWAVEQLFQKWIVTQACPVLKIDKHECVAIACVIARS